jgi:hypothetical protein
MSSSPSFRVFKAKTTVSEKSPAAENRMFTI